MSLFTQPSASSASSALSASSGSSGTPPGVSADVAHRDAVIERLRALDVLRMTPLEAMNALATLVDDARKPQS